MFVQKLLAHANMPLASAVEFSSSSERFRRLVHLNSDFHDDLKFWGWIVEVGMDTSEGRLVTPIYRPISRTL